MAIIGPKPWVNTFAKMTIFPLFELLVFIAQKGVFSLQNIIKDIFLANISQKKSWKMAIFGPKPWVNTFAKITIFPLFELLVFIAQNAVFSLQNIIKNIFLDYISLKRKVGKMSVFGPKPWVNLFGKMSIFPLF